MENQIVSYLKKIVSITSIGPREKELAMFLQKLFDKKDYKVTRQKIDNDRFNLLVEKGVGKKSILLYSHLDTIDILDGWKTNPLSLDIKNDKAYGLGAWDMKGGMVTNILTFLNFQPKNFKLKMVFCADEENISKGGHVLMNSSFLNDAQLILSTEPSFFYGNNGIVIGRPGRAVFNVEVTGEPKHYALYDKHVDINFFISDFIKEIGKIYRLDGSKKQFVFVRNISSKTIGISTPHTVSLELDSSIVPPNTNDQIKKSIQDKADHINLKFNNYFKIKINYLERETPFLESYEIKKNNVYLSYLKKTILKITGKKAVPYFRSSIADENIFGSHGKTVFGIGSVGGNAHAPNEWVSLSSLEKMYNILSNYLSEIDKHL